MDVIWNRWLRVWYVVGRDIKPPLGISPYEDASVWKRLWYVVRFSVWWAHVLIDKQLGSSRRNTWEKDHRQVIG